MFVMQSTKKSDDQGINYDLSAFETFVGYAHTKGKQTQIWGYKPGELTKRILYVGVHV